MVSVGSPGAITIRGNSPWPALKAMSKSPCMLYVGIPVPGPTRLAR